MTKRGDFFLSGAWSLFKFNNLRLILGKTLKFCGQINKKKSFKDLMAKSYVWGSYKGKTSRDVFLRTERLNLSSLTII